MSLSNFHHAGPGNGGDVVREYVDAHVEHFTVVILTEEKCGARREAVMKASERSTDDLLDSDFSLAQFYHIQLALSFLLVVPTNHLMSAI
jgi:hypothetical protein